MISKDDSSDGGSSDEASGGDGDEAGGDAGDRAPKRKANLLLEDGLLAKSHFARPANR
jgi:hypothetical protein